MARKATPRRKTTTEPDGTRRIVDRNANGEGSVFYDASKDRWRATYQDPATGRRRSVLGATRGAAEARREQRLAELAARAPGGILGHDPTIGQLVDWFVDRVADVRPNTLNTYRQHGRIITAELGQLRVSEIGVEHLRVFLGDLRTPTDTRPAYSDHMVSNVRARLRQILEEAVTLGYLASNPVTKIRAPRTSGPRKVKTTLTATQCRALVTAAAEHPMGAAVAILFLLGNRSSEVLGLAWSDLDLDAGTAMVQRGSTYAGKGVGQRLGPTKTTGTQGVHSLPPTVIALLRRHQAAQQVERERAGMKWRGPTYDGTDLAMVFANEHGGLVYSHRLYTAVRECCVLAGIDPQGVGTHTGRRSVITALYDAGLDLSDVAKHVGHSQMATTAGYVQHLAQRPQATADTAARLLDPGATG